ncbi:hypothetical protein [Mycolicibacterium stellerae]|uniref:hypothetical protein n=1 Tax=Mycolicibacterium stellerae TaxID=2358193 RepID=UPI0013DE774E|nr:hypothetical protein [Mycolicibacterium stellerae]
MLPLPDRAAAAGDPMRPITLNRDALARLFPFAARRVLGVESRRIRVTTVVWRDGGDELAVDPGGAAVATADGAVVVTIPVSCDQSGPSQAQVTFVVGTSDAPAGMYAATDGRPRGPAAITDRWADALTAFAWSAVLDLLASVSGTVGNDKDGLPLIPGALVATADGITVTPMARHPLGQLSS